MARLTFKVLERYAETTLVQINLDTGLKNQIRVQFAEYGHPLVGGPPLCSGRTGRGADRPASPALLEARTSAPQKRQNDGI